MGGLRRIKRKLAGRYAVEPLHAPAEPGSKKLSAVIQEFAEPLARDVDDDHFEAAITVAILCWNVALLPEDTQAQELSLIKRKMAEYLPARWVRELDVWTDRLVDRKKTLFADDRRMVVNYTVADEADGFHLYVVSTVVPDSPIINP